jgi:hypothetical protein
MGWAIARPGIRRLPVFAAGVVMSAWAATPAVAEDPVIPPPEANELALEGIGKLMRALELFMQSIPAYGQPYIDDDGNIVIPRVIDPEAPPALEPPVEDTGTTT